MYYQFIFQFPYKLTNKEASTFPHVNEIKVVFILLFRFLRNKTNHFGVRVNCPGGGDSIYKEGRDARREF